MKNPTQIERAILAWFKKQYGLDAADQGDFQVEYENLTYRVHQLNGGIMIQVSAENEDIFEFETTLWFIRDADSFRVETSIKYRIEQEFSYADPDLFQKFCEPIELPTDLPTPIGLRKESIKEETR